MDTEHLAELKCVRCVTSLAARLAQGASPRIFTKTWRLARKNQIVTNGSGIDETCKAVLSSQRVDNRAGAAELGSGCRLTLLLTSAWWRDILWALRIDMASVVL